MTERPETAEEYGDRMLYEEEQRAAAHTWTRAGVTFEVERERDGTLYFYAGEPVDGLSRWAQRAEPGDEVLAEVLALAEVRAAANVYVALLRRHGRLYSRGPERSDLAVSEERLLAALEGGA